MLNYIEQRILVHLSEIGEKEKTKVVNAFNKDLSNKFNKTEVHISNSIHKLAKKGYISINGRRGRGRMITILKPQLTIK